MKKIVISTILSVSTINLSFAEEMLNRQLTEEESIKIVQEEALNKMLDPDSTKFKITYTEPMTLKNEIDEHGNQYSPSIVCGEYNSKNKMGGYNGFKRFYSTINYKNNEISILLKFEEDFEDQEFIFNAIYDSVCKQ